MRKFVSILITVIFLLLLFYKIAYAESPYVLPYPSSMPGTLTYKLHLVYESLMRYWYFGSFGQFEYNLKQSDKYLVEAKILFEYKQYLLGYKALELSNEYFKNISPFLIKARKENKNITQKENLLKNAAKVHIDKINEIDNNAPDKFLWQPEKNKPIDLNIKSEIDKSIIIRRSVL